MRRLGWIAAIACCICSCILWGTSDTAWIGSTSYGPGQTLVSDVSRLLPDHRRVYAAAGTGGLVVFDRTGLLPVVAGTYTLPDAGDEASCVAAMGTLLFVGTSGGQILCLDGSDPTQLSLRTSAQVVDALEGIEGSGWSVRGVWAGSGSLVTTTSSEDGATYALSWQVTEDVMTPLARTDAIGRFADWQDPYLYVVGNKLTVYDFTDPAAPVAVGSLTLGDNATGVAVLGDSAYVSIPGTTVAVFDVHDPSAPRAIGDLLSDSGPPLRVSDGYLLTRLSTVAGYDLQLLDLGTQTDPRSYGTYGVDLWDYRVDGDRVYYLTPDALVTLSVRFR